jgi:hypothetical protein
MTTYISKIGRLPKEVREQLNLRLQDGLPGADIVAWLNHRPAVQAVLKKYFDARPVSEQNLSDWRAAGYLDWLRHQAACEAARLLAEQTTDLQAASPAHDLTDRFALVLAAELNRLAALLLQQETDLDKRLQNLAQINRQLAQLRHDDYRAKSLALRQEQWRRQVEQENRDEAERQAAAKRSLLKALVTMPDSIRAEAQLFGGGERGQLMADLMHRIRYDLPLEDWQREYLAARQAAAPIPAPPARTPAKPQKSNLIVPNKTKAVPPDARDRQVPIPQSAIRNPPSPA